MNQKLATFHMHYFIVILFDKTELKLYNFYAAYYFNVNALCLKASSLGKVQHAVQKKRFIYTTLFYITGTPPYRSYAKFAPCINS